MRYEVLLLVREGHLRLHRFQTGHIDSVRLKTLIDYEKLHLIFFKSGSIVMITRPLQWSNAQLLSCSFNS